MSGKKRKKIQAPKLKYELKFRRSIKSKLLDLILPMFVILMLIISFFITKSVIDVGQKVQDISKEALFDSTEKYILQVTVDNAKKNDAVLKSTQKDTKNLAQYTENIFSKPDIFARGSYWSAKDSMFFGANGQYLNNKDEITSVFVPNFKDINQDVIEDLELGAYLDFVFPLIYKNNPNTVAIYLSTEQETTRYFPNIDLGNVVPPDFQITKRPWYVSSNPENNPEQKAVWSPVYTDATGKGMMITAAVPVYGKNDKFIGAVGMDITLDDLSTDIKNIQLPGEGYAFLIDTNGYALALPEQGYKDIIGHPIRKNESYINLLNSSTGFAPVIAKMISGETGIETLEIEGKQLFVAYAPVQSTGWSLAGVIEADKILLPVVRMQEEINSYVKSSILWVLLVGLVIIIILLSVGFILINHMINPLQKLSSAAKEIGAGNLNIKLPKPSDDEIGQLTYAFSQMVNNIKKSRAKLESYSKDLEKQVEIRTKQLDEKAKDSENTKIATLNIMDDIDETNRNLVIAQDKLKQNMDELKKLNIQKDQFISIAAHELKTPMTSIRGFSNLLNNPKVAENPELRKKYLNIIFKDTTRLATLISNVLELSRMDLGVLKISWQNIKIPDLIKEVREQMDIIIKSKNLKSEYKVENNLPIISIDKDKIIQVISNLINNAVHYTDKGKISLGVKKVGKDILFSVSDTGSGIPKEHLKEIFERFYQVDNPLTRKINGTGLGLSLCKGFVEAMGGKIWVESKLNKGTTFYFTIPIKRKQHSKKREINMFKENKEPDKK